MNKQNTEQLKKEFERKFSFKNQGYDTYLVDENSNAVVFSTDVIWNFFLPHLISSDEIKREAEYQNVLDFVTWVILNKNDLEVAHDFDEYCKKKNLTQSKEGGE